MLTTPPRHPRRHLARQVRGTYATGAGAGQGAANRRVASERSASFDDAGHPVHACEPPPGDPVVDEVAHDLEDVVPVEPADLASGPAAGTRPTAGSTPASLGRSAGAVAQAVDLLVPDARARTSSSSPSASADRELPDDAQLAQVVATLRAADRLTAEAVRLAGRLDGAQVVAEEGLTLDTALRLHTRTTRGDVSAVLGAAEVLRHMPVTAGLFVRGVFTWGHIRALAHATRSFDACTRRALDTYLGQHGARLERLDGDGRLAAIDDAVLHHTPAATLEDRAERDTIARCLIITPRLDGTGTIFTDLDVEGFATVTGRLDHEADTPLASASPGDEPTGIPRNAADALPGSRAQLLADALVRICGSTGGAGASGAPVRFTVLVDTDTITDRLAGLLQPAIAARPPRLVRRTLDRLSCDAALDVVLRDGHDLIAAQRYAPDITATTRRAVLARDGGCRFPGCRAPATWCDIHHVEPRAAGGDHRMSNLVALCRRHHVVVHRRGWSQQLEPDGTLTVTRNRRSWTTRPRLTDRLPPPGTDPPDRGPPDRRPRRTRPSDRPVPGLPVPRPPRARSTPAPPRRPDPPTPPLTIPF